MSRFLIRAAWFVVATCLGFVLALFLVLFAVRPPGGRARSRRS